jgi:hypothetical protein
MEPPLVTLDEWLAPSRYFRAANYWSERTLAQASSRGLPAGAARGRLGVRPRGDSAPAAEYVLGHSKAEVDRLALHRAARGAVDRGAAEEDAFLFQLPGVGR